MIIIIIVVIGRQDNPRKILLLRLTHEMVLQVFHHAERAEALHADYFEEGVVADRELLVLRIVKVALLDYGPDLLDDLVAGHRVLTD